MQSGDKHNLGLIKDKLINFNNDSLLNTVNIIVRNSLYSRDFDSLHTGSRQCCINTSRRDH